MFGSFGRSEMRSFLERAPQRMTRLEDDVGTMQPRVAACEFHLKDLQNMFDRLDQQFGMEIKRRRFLDGVSDVDDASVHEEPGLSLTAEQAEGAPLFTEDSVPATEGPAPLPAPAPPDKKDWPEKSVPLVRPPSWQPDLQLTGADRQ